MRAFLPVLAYSALIFWASSLPSLAPPSEVPHLDKVAHLLEYGFLGVLLTRAWLHLDMKRGGLIIVLTVLVGGVFAAFDETWQGYVGRQMSVADWGADVCGLLVASIGWTRQRVL